MPLSYDYFSAGLRAGDDGLEEIVGPALDSEEADGECSRRAQVRPAPEGRGARVCSRTRRPAAAQP